jgi:hypothetical protein
MKLYCKSTLGKQSTKYSFSTLERDVHVQLANQRRDFRAIGGESQAGGLKDGKTS